MDYKKAYKKALELARKGYHIPEIFPELKESEDERIGNLIYCLIRDRSDNQKLLEHNGVSVDKALAYLEKQKEKKPSTEETELNSIAFLEQMGYTCIPPGKEQKPGEWGEEDEEMIARICANLEYLVKEAGCDSKLKEKLEERIKWMQRLKSLKNRGNSPKSNTNSPHWKPSEEHFQGLRRAITKAEKGSDAWNSLTDLYEQLEKLQHEIH